MQEKENSSFEVRQSDKPPQPPCADGDLAITRRTALLTCMAGMGSVIGSQTVVGSSPGSSKEPVSGEQSIEIDNSVYDIVFGEKTSDDWTFDGDGQLFNEFYAVRSDGTTDTSSESSIIDSYPDTGDPGETYNATVDFETLSVEITRSIELDPTDAVFTVSYQAENVGSSPLSDLSLYQYTDYDLGGDTIDTGQYAVDPFEYIYQTDSENDIFVGYRSESGFDAHDVDVYNALPDRIDAGDLQGNDRLEDADVTSAVRVDLGTVDAGEQVTRTFTFAAGNSQAEIEELLADDDFGPGEFEVVAITEATPTEVSLDESFSVQYTVKNVGDNRARQGIRLEVAGQEVATKPDTLTSGQSVTNSFTDVTLPESVSAGETIELTVRTNNDAATTDVAMTDGDTGGDDNSASPAVTDYTNQEEMVETPGLLDAISDWRADEIETPLLVDVIDAWRSGTPVS